MSFYEAKFLILGNSYYRCSSYERTLMYQFIFRTKNRGLCHYQKSWWAWVFYRFHPVGLWFPQKNKTRFSFISFFFLLFFPPQVYFWNSKNLCVFGLFLFLKQTFVVYYKWEWNVPFPHKYVNLLGRGVVWHIDRMLVKTPKTVWVLSSMSKFLQC